MRLISALIQADLMISFAVFEATVIQEGRTKASVKE
jgi:hypothetical protein